METDLPLEVIGGYKVHPAASLFPLIEGEDFEDLVFSIKTLGVLQAIVVSKGMLIDGRNRLRAVTRLRKEGCTLDLPVKELGPEVESVSEYIFDCNVHRRNLTPDQTVGITLQVWPMIAEEKKAKQAATQFKPGVSPNPGGIPKAQVDTVSYPPETTGESTVNTKTCSPSLRDVKQKNEQSTVGQIAKQAKSSHHKAAQGVAVAKAVEAGNLPKDTIAKVSSGEVKLKDVAPKPKKKERSRDLQLELALYHVTQGMAEYMAVEYASIRLLELAINANIDLLKKELRK
jgi:hypothetical protein